MRDLETTSPDHENAPPIAADAPCGNCGHPADWHRLDDSLGVGPTDPNAKFRCIGYDCTAPGQPTECELACPTFRRWPVVADDAGDHKAHTALLRQVGWIGHARGNMLYPLDTPPGREQEPGGYSPVYIEVGDE